MSSSIMLAATAALSLFSAASAHLAIQSPPPIPGSAAKDPLSGSGSNFPCQGADLSNPGQRTSMAVGETQKLSFNLGGGANTAVHGGGSCQLSLTYETDPAKLKDPANWKVIYSIVEGCPTNYWWNLDTAKECDPASGDVKCVNAFDFTIPSEARNGDAIFAWTWFNNIGNREMYMNCAAVTISGGEDKIDELPAMFVANIGSVSGTCQSTQYQNVDFPNPGKYVTTHKPAGPVETEFPIVVPSGCGDAVSPPKNNNPTSSAATPSATPAPSSSSAPSNPGGVFAPGAGSSSAAAQQPAETSTPATQQPAETSTPAAEEPTPAAPSQSTPEQPAQSSAAAQPSAAAPSTGNQGNCYSGQIECSITGFFCIDKNTFGLCAWGCATPMKVAPGTKCENGGIDFAKRDLQIPPQGRRLLSFFA